MHNATPTPPPAQAPGAERTPLKLRSVFAFAFDSDMVRNDGETACVDHVSAYERNAVEITLFIDRHKALGHSIGVFKKGEWF